MDEEVARMFYEHPRVLQLEADLKKVKTKLADIERIVVNAADPSVRPPARRCGR